MSLGATDRRQTDINLLTLVVRKSPNFKASKSTGSEIRRFKTKRLDAM